MGRIRVSDEVAEAFEALRQKEGYSATEMLRQLIALWRARKAPISPAPSEEWAKYPCPYRLQLEGAYYCALKAPDIKPIASPEVCRACGRRLDITLKLMRIEKTLPSWLKEQLRLPPDKVFVLIIPPCREARFNPASRTLTCPYALDLPLTGEKLKWLLLRCASCEHLELIAQIKINSELAMALKDRARELKDTKLIPLRPRGRAGRSPAPATPLPGHPGPSGTARPGRRR